MVELLEGRYDSAVTEYRIIDCRFPYEYRGGHIINAVNVNTQDQLDRILLSRTGAAKLEDDEAPPFTFPEDHHNVVLVFHCEHSLHRAPRL